MKKLKGKPDNCLKILLRKKFNNFVIFTQELKIFSWKNLTDNKNWGIIITRSDPDGQSRFARYIWISACPKGHTSLYMVRSVLQGDEIFLVSFFVYRKPLAGRVVQKRLLPMRKNKTPTVIVGMRSGNSKLQNRGRPFKNEVGETV